MKNNEIKKLVKELYRDGIIQVFGTGDDEYLKRAVDNDIHFGDEAPGQWSPGSVLEIYCENGIPNATDYWSPAEHGFPGKTVWNSEKWHDVDSYVNLMLAAAGVGNVVFHEPYNSAVVNICWHHPV